MDNSQKSKVNILIVDDDILIAESTKFYLRKANYNAVATASNAQEAIKLTKENPPDVILMDINLGDVVDGIWVANEIKTFADIPIIFVTAYTDSITIERAKKVGFCGYLTKPFKNLEMLHMLEKALKSKFGNKHMT